MEPKKQDKPEIKALPAYRYYCHACTGRAFYAEMPEVFKKPRVCRNCGASLNYEADKWIAN